MRIRALKPGFFKNEQLAELSPWHRLCYEGLWLCADRDGRLQDRPKRLKAEIFPYDELDMNALLWDLTHAGFIVRYSVGGHPYICIPSWTDHQHPRGDEAESSYPPYVPGTERQHSDPSTFPAARPVQLIEPKPLPERATDSSLHSDGPVAPLRMGQVEVGQVDVGGAPTPPAHVRAADLMELWNVTTHPPIPRCRELTDDRRRKIRARMAKRPSLAEWREAFEFIDADPFYRGQNDRQWTAEFDYVIRNDTVVAKLLERARTKRPTRGLPSQADWACPHEPKCGHPSRCQMLQQIAVEKAKAAYA